ncbi:single-stranded DNA-binding protein [Actinoplanes sp. DH11]|uniref:single-stranded DNA-binding protein n=1 Tax=Actinoplanes sp. DH11 TaxID=2857011 RepID=UPI001E4D8CFF|nr:single-stranded DNA-binding protein [Actinoplanes sp. DH11]
MFDTNIVVVGNVLTAPEWRLTNNSQQLVANFRVASTARRYDRESGRWIDGDSLRVRVTAWRRLAEGVTSSILVGDPVIVYGRIYTREWVDEDKRTRVSYELEAFAIGHDLNRGRSRFQRNKPVPALSAVEDPEADALIRGESTTELDETEAPVRYGDGVPEPEPGEPEPGFLEVVAGLTDGPVGAGRPGGTGEPEPGEEENTGTAETAPSPLAAARRTRRGAKREPVAA